MAQWFKLQMPETGGYTIEPVLISDDGILPSAASPGELIGQIDGLIDDLQRLREEASRISEPVRDIFGAKPDA